MKLRYLISAVLFSIVHRHHNGMVFWFPRRLELDVTHIPTMKEYQEATGPSFIQGQLTFRHGLLHRRSATLNVYKQFVLFMPSYWRWSGSGDLTPGFIVEKLEQHWCQRRQAMNASLQLQATASDGPD